MNKTRIYIARYTMTSGEYEFSGYTVFEARTTQSLKNKIHEYFMDFYGDPHTEYDEENDSYLYNSGSVGVKKIYWEEITEAQRKVLSDLRVA